MEKQKEKEFKRDYVFCVEFTWVEKPNKEQYGENKAVIQRQTNFVLSIKDAVNLIREWLDPLDDNLVGISYKDYKKTVEYCPWDSEKSFNKWMKREAKRTRLFKKIEKELNKVGFYSISQIVGGRLSYDISNCFSDNPSELLHTISIEHMDFEVQKGRSVLTEIAKQMAEKIRDED